MSETPALVPPELSLGSHSPRPSELPPRGSCIRTTPRPTPLIPPPTGRSTREKHTRPLLVSSHPRALTLARTQRPRLLPPPDPGAGTGFHPTPGPPTRHAATPLELIGPGAPTHAPRRVRPPGPSAAAIGAGGRRHLLIGQLARPQRQLHVREGPPRRVDWEPGRKSRLHPLQKFLLAVAHPPTCLSSPPKFLIGREVSEL